jgi:glycosyltransferase involved in cell wall biosynthesis
MSNPQLERGISLILPAHNEEENIKEVVESCLSYLPSRFRDFEIIVVDDGSEDKTCEIAKEISERDNRVRIIRHKKNRGYGSALRTGFEEAKKDLIFFMDSDRQFTITEMENFIKYIGKYDIIAGFRIKRKDSFLRYIVGRLFTIIGNTLFGVNLKDIDCAFKMFERKVIDEIDLISPGLLLNTEIIAKARRNKRSIVEIGVEHLPRLYGKQSVFNPKVVFQVLGEIIKLWWRM